MTIKSFLGKGTEDIALSINSKEARQVLPRELCQVARRKLSILNNARTLTDLAALQGNRLESLRGNRKGQRSIRVNDQYRICFLWKGNHAEEVEITDYH